MTLQEHVGKFRLGITGVARAIPFDLGRCRGPFLDMAREDRRFEVINTDLHPDGSDDTDWHWILNCDAVYVQNPVWDPHLRIILKAKLLGIPVWADWGDDPFHVHPSNPGYAGFALVDTLKANIEWIMEHADVCSVPTTTARDSFPEKWRQQVMVVGEACRWKPQNGMRRKMVSWRGMGSHEVDVESVASQLKEVAGDPEFADWQWALFGEPHWRLKVPLSEAIGEPWEAGKHDNNKRLLIYPCFPDPFLMFEAWKSAAPFLHIVPLADNPFNRSKPPNAWMEATACGAGVIGPDFYEWRVPGLIRYEQGRGPNDFASVLRREMQRFELDPKAGKTELGCVCGLTHPNVELSRADIYPAKTLRSENQKRWAVVRKLVEIVEGKRLKAEGERLKEVEA